MREVNTDGRKALAGASIIREADSVKATQDLTMQRFPLDACL